MFYLDDRTSMATEQDMEQKQKEPALSVRMMYTELAYDDNIPSDTFQTCQTLPTSTQSTYRGNMDSAEQQKAGVAASSLNYTETAPTVSAERQDDGRSRPENDEVGDLSSFEIEKETGNEENEMVASLEMMRRAQAARAEVASSNQETRVIRGVPTEVTYTGQVGDPLQNGWRLTLPEIFQQQNGNTSAPVMSHRGIPTVVESPGHRLDREFPQRQTNDGGLILPQPGDLRSNLPQQERGRLQNRTYIRRPGEEREDSNGSRRSGAATAATSERSRSPAEVKPREGRKRMTRTKEALQEDL